eukprot:165542_1
MRMTIQAHVVDKYGQTANARLAQQEVTFEASQSHDMNGKPCLSFECTKDIHLPVSIKSRSQQPGAQQLDDSTTQDTSAMSGIPTINRIDQQSQSIPLHPPPPVPAASGTKYNSSDLSSREPPLARNRQHSYNVPPPGVGRVASAGAGVRSRNRKTSPPAPKRLGGKHIPKTKSLNLNEEDGKEFAIDQVSFTAILRQVDVGVEMTDRMKEVVRKFCKHQQMGADKLQEIYHKLPSTYVDSDGMKGFADVCALVHTLILETVSAQKRLADFLFRDVVPKMDGYIKEKQKQIQELKRDNAQAEMKVKNAINAMHKASNTAKNSASKAKQLARESHSKGRKGSYNHDAAKKKKKGKMGGLFNKFGGDNAHHNVPPDEQAYLKAQTNQLNYEASVMAANYEQNTYNEIAARFKRDCKAIEQQRLLYCQDKIEHVVNANTNFMWIGYVGRTTRISGPSPVTNHITTCQLQFRTIPGHLITLRHANSGPSLVIEIDFLMRRNGYELRSNQDIQKVIEASKEEGYLDCATP